MKDIKVEWSKVEGAASYSVEVDGEVVADGITELSYLIEGLEPKTSYDIRIQANPDPNDPEWCSSDWSDVKTETTKEEAPPAEKLTTPDAAVDGTPTATAAKVKWTVDPKASSYTVDGKPATSPHTVDNTAAPGSKMTVKVIAVGDGTTYLNSDAKSVEITFAAARTTK